MTDIVLYIRPQDQYTMLTALAAGRDQIQIVGDQLGAEVIAEYITVLTEQLREGR